MASPTFPPLTDAQGDALSDMVDYKTGIRHWKKGATKFDSPSVFTRYQQLHEALFELISRFGGACIKVGGLNVGVLALNYQIGATEKVFAGIASQPLSPSATNYLYLDSDQTLKISTTAWPGTGHFKIAKVFTSGTEVTVIIDPRMRNFQIDIVNAWWSVIAGGDVDVNGKALKAVGQQWFSASTELTLASDTITPTQAVHSVDTQADAAADDLVTITADAAKINRLVILRCENAARVVTIKSTGNIKLKHGNLVLDDVEKFILAMQITATTWIAEPMNFASFGPLLQDLDCNLKTLRNIGVLAVKNMGTRVIATDAITVAGTFHRLVPESGYTDDLKTINGGEQHQLLLITPNSGTFDITVYDCSASGGNNIFLSKPGSTVHLADPTDWLLLFEDIGNWSEIARSKHRLDDLVGTGQVIPLAIGPCHYPGTLTINQETWDCLAPFPFKLKRARGRVRTAPTGGSCVIDVLKNGASVFAADANAINIADGTLEDNSDTIDVDFAQGDRISVKVKAVNGAVSATVSFDAYVQAITAA